MPTRLPDVAEELRELDDPRLNPDFWRSVPADGRRSAAMVVGVVHDHPASTFRVRAVADAFDPDVVGLELPGLAVPTFERIAREEDRAGTDEMSAAVAACPAAEAVGIDTLGPRFLRSLASNARAEDASPGTVRRVLGDVVGIARHAVSCRVTGNRLPAKRAAGGHDVSVADPPDVQADDERTHVARSRALLGAVERPHAELLLDGTREETMADGIDSLRKRGSVLAVVGIDHLDGVVAGIG